MTAPTYFAMGGVIFAREHMPMTMEKARITEAVHRLNASHWLTNGDERSLTARLGLAKIEQSLADEMAAAIAAASSAQPVEMERAA